MEQRFILVFLCPRLDFFAGDPAAAGSGQSWRPARRPKVQMCRFSGLYLCHIQVCVCACVCMLAHPFNAHEWDWLNYSSELTFYSFPFFFSLKICFVWFIFQDGELWYCQVFVRLPVSLQCINREMTRSDSQTKAHLFLQETHLRTSIWKHKKLQEEINPIISLPPCGWWMSSSFKCLYL